MAKRAAREYANREHLRSLYLLSPEGYSEEIVSPFEPSHLTSVGINLTVGRLAYHTTRGARVDLAPGSPLKLYPGDSAEVFTAEELDLPDDVFGQVVPRLQLASEGLSQAFATKIDFGFGGPLRLRVQNTSSGIVDIDQGQEICGIILFATEGAAPRPFNRGQARVPVTLQVPTQPTAHPDDRHLGDVESTHSTAFFSFYRAMLDRADDLDKRIEERAHELEQRLNQFLGERAVRVALWSGGVAQVGLLVAIVVLMVFLLRDP